MSLELFTSNVKSLFEAQDRIRDIAREVKERRDPLKERVLHLQEQVTAYMEQTNIDVCNFKDEKLELKSVQRHGSLTKKTLEAALVKYFRGDEAAAGAAFAFILDDLGSREIKVLRRSRQKKRKADQPQEAPASKRAPAVEDDDSEDDEI